MTKREPFAEAYRCITGTENELWTIYIDGTRIGHFGSRRDAEDRSYLINAAAESLVKEAVKKAVEEFRERAALLAGAWYCHDGYFIARKIRALPTEPEA